MVLSSAAIRGGPARARPMLLALVYGVFLVLVGVTASALVAITSAHISNATLNATVSRDASLVDLFVNTNLASGDLVATAVSPARVAELDGKLAALTREDQIIRIEVRALDGLVLFASEPRAVGARPVPSAEMRQALRGQASAALVVSAGLEDVAPPAIGASSVVREYLPVVRNGGRALAAVALWRDAAPLLSTIEGAQRDILVVVLGAAVVLAAILFIVFRAAQARITHQQAALLEATRRDALTGLLNHGAVVAILGDLVEEARRGQGAVGVALLDVDNYKLINETHGHDAANGVLVRVALLVASDAGSADHVARYGPDEFLLVWHTATATDVERRLIGLRAELTALSVQLGDSEPLPITVSAGIAAFPEHAGSVTELLSTAGVALGEAKASGGDAMRVAHRDEERAAFAGFDVLQGLVIAVDTKDRYTKRHSEDVARYAVFLAQRLGLDDDLIRVIQVSGLLHDVGKIGIPDALLRKPGKLTAEEFDVFKQHVVLGDAIVRDLPDTDLVRAGIRHHHERWDGRGYLEGLSGEEIPLIGRIMAVADAFSAMTTTRPYRKALPLEEALKRLGDAAGTQLDETLAGAFITGIETAHDAPLPGPEARPSTLWTPQRRVA
jgi:diguanylate cyclase (GGDEF)-like protein